MIFTNCLLEKRQTIHEKIQFMHIFGLKTKISKIVSDLSWRIFWELFNAVFKIPKSLLHPEIFNKTPENDKKFMKKYSFLYFFLLKTQKSKNILIYHKAFSESFSMPFSEFQNLYCIWRYSTKTPENDKIIMKKYSFLHF